MRTVKLRLQPDARYICEGLACIRKPGDAVVIKRSRARSLLLHCPCGCGDAYPVNLDARVGPAWHLRRSAAPNSISLYPSVWRESDCESHFIIWKSNIYIFEEFMNDETFPHEVDDAKRLQTAILRLADADGSVDPDAATEVTDADPWDIVAVCESLVQQGVLAKATYGKRHYLRNVP